MDISAQRTNSEDLYCLNAKELPRLAPAMTNGGEEHERPMWVPKGQILDGRATRVKEVNVKFIDDFKRQGMLEALGK